MGRLDGKVALITGGARGQGASHVKKFVQEGARVVFTDILVDEGKEIEQGMGEKAKFLEHDVTKSDDWQKVVEQTEQTFGPIDILINNAGVVTSTKIEDLTEEVYRKVIDINQVGTFLGMKTALPSLKKSGNASIINLSSINGLRGGEGTAPYDASKFAVRGMTKTAALEFAEFGIRVNSVHPGVIQTPMIDSEGTPKEALAKLAEGIPMKRNGQSEEVSALVTFLASDEASYSTGAEFVIDGGVTASNY